MSNARQQYRSIPLRSHVTQSQTTEEHKRQQLAQKQRFVPHQQMPVVPDEKQLYQPAFSHTSTLHYQDRYGNEVLEQGKKRLVFHRDTIRRSPHRLFFVGTGMIATLLLFVGSQWAWNAIQQHTLDTQYGYPRTWQTNAVVGHADSALHPSHFIFENWQGHAIVIEFPGGNITHAIVYSGPAIYAPHPDQVPVTGTFEDVNGDGRPDMEIDINGQPTVTFLNTGTKFVAPSQ